MSEENQISAELKIVSDLSARMLPYLEIMKKLIDEEFSKFPVESFEYMCTKIPKEDLDKAFELMEKVDKALTMLSATFHKRSYEFQAASGYTDWLKKAGKVFGYEKSAIAAKPEADPIQNLKKEDAEEMIKQLKQRFNL